METSQTEARLSSRSGAATTVTGTIGGLMPTDGAPAKQILVIGDWVVDDYWVIGRHTSELSTNVGHDHSRSLHNPGNSIREFCGAGLVARFLYHSVFEHE